MGSIVKAFSDVLLHVRDNTATVSWMLDLLGQIQITTPIDVEFTNYSMFMCNIFIASVVLWSSYYDLFNVLDDIGDASKMMNIFPYALACLLKRNIWKNCTFQVIFSISISVYYERFKNGFN